jgi:uncharacterized repeat protein (TIGR02543 family)
MPIYLKTSTAANSWRKAASLYLKTSTATNSWRKIVSAYIKTNDGWRSLFSSVVFPSIEQQVVIGSTGGTNPQSTIMSDGSPVTLVGTKYHWNDADGFTYVWQKSPNNINWSNIGTAQSTTNPASGSSSNITKQLSASDFTSGSDMYFRFVFGATNSTYGTSSDSISSSLLISYYGTPTPQPGSPSITGSTVVGSTASGNIGTWTNSPTSYDYRVYYTSGLTSYPLTYAGVKSVSSKFLSGFSAALVTSSAHGYKVNDTVVVSGMDSLFNGSYTITAKISNTLYFTIDAPTAWSNAGTGYSSGTYVSSGGNAYISNQTISSVSQFNGGTLYSAGAIVYFGNNRYQSKLNNNIGNSVTNTTWWDDLGSFAPGGSKWTIQSFSDEPASGTTTAPNYYDGSVSSSTSIPIAIASFDYKQGIDLRGSASSGTGLVLNFGVKAYNQVTATPSEYLGTAFIYGVPAISIGSITPSSTSASVPFTSSYVASYLLNLYTQPSITNVTGGTSTVTYFAQNTFTSGQQVVISGINPSQYNGTRTIQSATSTSFTVSANITGAYVSGGTAKVTVSGYPLIVNSNTSPRSITGLSELTTYYLEMTPSNNGSTGTMQTASFTTIAQPTISNISVFNSTPFPSSATSISVSNTPPSNTGSVSWVNGSNTSLAGLFSVSGAGSGGTGINPSSLLTSSIFDVVSTGTANVSIRAINTNKTVNVSWSQTNAQSYRILYTISGVPGTQEIAGNSSASNPSVQIGTSANTFTITNITVYPNINQGGTGVTLSSTASATGADRITDTAGSGSVTFTSLTWTITWSANGGTGGGTTTENRGSLHTAPSPGTRTGYDFVYWRNPVTGDILYTVNDGGTFNPTRDLTFLAVWSLKTYTVSFDANGGTGAPANQTKTHDTALTLSSTAPTRTGYTFNGWNTSADGTGTNYAAGASYTTNAAVTLYAKWTANSYTITYNGNSSTSGSTAPGSYTTGGTAYTIAANGFLRTGFTFAGWNTSTNGTGTSYSPGGSYSTSANLLLYAQWTANVYTVTFNGNGATGGSMANQSASTTTALTLNAFTRTNYQFMGWAVTSGGTAVVYANGANYSFAANITLYALWGPVITSISRQNGGSGGAYKMRWQITGTNFASYFISINYGTTTSMGTVFTNTISSNPVSTNVGSTLNDYYQLTITPYTLANGGGVAGQSRITTIKRNTTTSTTQSDNY